MQSNRNQWCFRATTLAISVAAALSASAQTAPKAPALPEPAEEIIITGTSIRGAAAVGSNVITIGREEIEASGAQTLQQVLSSVPALTGFGNAGQGASGTADGAGTFSPTVHGLGASASNGTLILVDGHRIPLTGINHTSGDPNVIAPLAIQRVEVLTEGASSIYGSDAVAGVLNFITRKHYNGVEISGQVGFAKNYKTNNVNFITGNAWDSGSYMLAYSFSHRDSLSSGSRSITGLNHTALGGGNLATANCSPATLTITGANAGTYAFPYGGAAIPNALVTGVGGGGICDYSSLTDLLPEDNRHSILSKIEKDVSKDLSVSADIVYSRRDGYSAINRGAVTANVFGSGATPAGGAGQINPFYVPVGGATTETIRFQADDLLGPGAHNKTGAESFFVTAGAEYKFGGDWLATFGGTVGRDDSFLNRIGALCTSCAQLTLNGTPNQAGSTTTSAIAGTNVIVTNLPLTTANALDVWNPVATNRTSAAVRAQLTDSNQYSRARQTLRDITLKFDGSVFALPGGEVRAAVGGEIAKYDMDQVFTVAGNAGPASLISSVNVKHYQRTVKSAYVEVLVPIIGEANATSFARRLDFNVSARGDNYSDFGSTSNPKFALTWEIAKGYQFKANYAKSFTAPALTSRGDENGYTTESNYNQLATTTIPLTFPGMAALALVLPAGSCNTVSCNVGTTTAPGIQVNGGNKNLKPQTGKSYSFGFDVRPSFIPGLTAAATFWNAEYNGAITAPSSVFAINSAGLNSLFTLFPVAGGATAAQLAAITAGLPQNGAVAGPIYAVYSFQQINALNLKANGIDLDLHYDIGTSIGEMGFGVQVSKKLKFDQQVGTGGATFSVLNTAGFNTTFPSNALSGRGSFNWKNAAWAGGLFANYFGAYKNWNGAAPFPVISTNGAPTGGGQDIPSQTTWDMQLSYNFGKDGSSWLKDVRVSLEGNNITDKKPPYFNSNGSSNYDGFGANPVGRTFTIGLNKKW